MKYHLVLATLLAIATSNAVIITVSYADSASVGSGSAGNTITKTSGVFTVDAKAYAVNDTAVTPSFVAARLRDYGTPGLGVCNASENSDGNCSTSGDPNRASAR